MGNEQQALVKTVTNLLSPQVIKKIAEYVPSDYRQTVGTERWLRQCMYHISQIEGIEGCTAKSVLNELFKAATWGLTIDPSQGVTLVRYGNQVKLALDYRAKEMMTRRSKMVKSIVSNVVYSNDTFECNLGDDSPVTHYRTMTHDVGEIVGAYAAVKLLDGTWQKEVMVQRDLEKVRAAAKTDKVWSLWAEEMSRAKVIQRASKHWPLEPEISKVVRYDLDEPNTTNVLEVPFSDDEVPDSAGDNVDVLAAKLTVK